MAPFRILSLDGGGIRGVLTASILERLEADCPGFLAGIDLFAGTSTGGILALGLAAGMTPKQIRLLYERSGEKVFANNPWWERLGFERIDQFARADYDNSALMEALARQFKSKKLGDLKKKVIVVSFDLDNEGGATGLRQWKPKIFNNFEGDNDCKEKILDVAMRTSAAPTFFPIYQGYTDGGVIANNPAMCALAQAVSTGKSGGGKAIEEVRLLSVGTGVNLNFVEVKEKDRGNWGLVQWAPSLINLMLEGGGDLVNYQCKQILGEERYRRVNPVVHKPINLDDIKQIPYMKGLVENMDEEAWDATVEWVRKNYMPKRAKKKK